MRFSNPSRVLSNSLPLLPLNLRQHPQKEGANARGFCGLIGARRPHCGASRCTSARPFSKRPSPRRILPSALNGDAQVPRRESYARNLIQTLHPALNSARAAPKRAASLSMRGSADPGLHRQRSAAASSWVAAVLRIQAAQTVQASLADLLSFRPFAL
jgi:hypothetical protein